MRLADFIRKNVKPIVAEWEAFAQSLTPAADHMGPLVLRNHIHQILAFIEGDIESAQTPAQQVEKSHGEKPEAAYPTPAEVHASLRYDGGFNMNQMVSEYRALRASVVKLWEASSPGTAAHDVADLVRFNEAIDQALTESIHDYSKKIDLSRNLFLGILSHDLRNPLSAVSMSAELTIKIGALSERQTMLQTQIAESSRRATDIVSSLLDLTRTRLGSGLPIIREPMDIGFISHQLVEEMRVLHPDREFILTVTGDVAGDWDKARIGQVFSNLLGNAVQYGFRDTPVTIAVKGGAEAVVLSVHNQGVPIKATLIGSIFNALTRVQPDDDPKHQAASANLGLGLFITKEIVTAHGGTIKATSSEVGGTTFTASFPRTAVQDTPDPDAPNQNGPAHNVPAPNLPAETPPTLNAPVPDVKSNQSSPNLNGSHKPI